MEKTSKKIHKIDATGKVAGRLATQIAQILMGKDKPDYQPYLDGGDAVMVENVDKMKFTGKKLEQKLYYHHSGYPGGLKEQKMGEVFEKNPSEVLKKAVWNMLPKNKLRKPRIKKLKFQ
jgi:large subunit ribosomal protein L13